MEKKSKKQSVTQGTPLSLISKELKRYQQQIDELFSALEMVDLRKILDDEARLKSAKLKQEMMIKMPQLIAELDNLKNRSKVKSDDIKGNKTLSPLEDGTLDD